MHQRLDVGDMRQGQQPFTVQLLIVAHVACDHCKADIHLPQKGLDLQHLGHLTRGGDEFVECPALRFVQCHTQRDLDLIPQRPPVDHPAHTLEDARAPEPLQPPRKGRGSDPCPFRQRAARHFRFDHHVAQNAPVCVIKHDFTADPVY